MNKLIGVSGKIKVGKDLVGEIISYIHTCNELKLLPNYEFFKLFKQDYSSCTIKKYGDNLKDCVCIILGCTRVELEDQEFKNKKLGEEWRVWTVWTTNEDKKIFSSEEEASKFSEDIWGTSTPRINSYLLTPRLILQLLGTEGGRNIIHPNIWVTSLYTKFNDESNWIITDVRFPNNEGRAIKNRDGLIIGVKRFFKLRFPEYEEFVNPDKPYDIPREVGINNTKLWEVLTHESEMLMGDHSWCDVIIENNDTKEELFNKLIKLKIFVKNIKR